MKNTLCIFLCIITAGQSMQIVGSSDTSSSSKNIVLESELYNKYTTVADFIIEGLDFFQASHAYEQRLNLQQALSEAKKETLDSVAHFKKRHPEEFDACNTFVKSQEKEYLSMAAYLKLGLTYPQAQSSYENNLTIPQIMLLTKQTKQKSL